MPILRWPQTDEIPTAPSPCALEDDSWFAAAQRCFVGVAIAGAISALSLSTAIAGTFSSNDEAVPQANFHVVEEDCPPLPRSGDLPTFIVWATDEQIVPQQAVFVAPEDDWQAAPYQGPPVQMSGPAWDDQALSWALDEPYHWTAQWITPPIVAPAARDDSDFVLQVLPGDDDAWQLPPFLCVTPAVTLWHQQDEIETPAAPLAADEDYWQTFPLPPKPAIVSFPVEEDFPLLSLSGTTGAVSYLTLRAVSGRYATTGITSRANQKNLRPTYPGRNVPLGRIVKDHLGNMTIEINPAWDDYLNFEHQKRLGGVNESTLPEVKDTITAGQAAALFDQRILVVQDQWLANLAQAINATTQVVQAAALPGAEQIPPVQFSGGEGGSGE